MIDFKLVLEELSDYKHNRAEVLYNNINERLNKSLKSYYEELQGSVNTLNYRNSLNVLKKINSQSPHP